MRVQCFILSSSLAEIQDWMLVPQWGIGAAHFLSILQDEMSWRPNFTRTCCPDDAKAIGHHACRNLCLWTKHEKLKFSPGTAATEWFLIMKLPSVQLYSVQSMMCFDRPLHIRGCFLQPKQGVPACSLYALVNMSVFCADLKLELGGRIIAGLYSASWKQWDMRLPELCFNNNIIMIAIGNLWRPISWEPRVLTKQISMPHPHTHTPTPQKYKHCSHRFDGNRRKKVRNQ